MSPAELADRESKLSLDRSEIARKAVHIGVGFLAFTMRYLGPLGSALMAAFAIFHNLVILPRIGGDRLLRSGERKAGRSVGILLYPVTVLCLILVFYRRLEVAAAVWGILAFGDGMAAVVGMTLGRRKLPWNPRKSWAGTSAFFLFGTAAAAALLLWTVPGRYEPSFALVAAAVAALVAAVLESLPQGLDDNLGVPLVSGLVLWGIVLGHGRWADVVTSELVTQLVVGAVLSAVLAVAAYATGGVNRSGATAGFLIATTLYTFLSWPGYLQLFLFFVLGTGATKLGYSHKAKTAVAQEDGGRRGARHAFANAGVATACAVFSAAAPVPLLFRIAFAAAFATAAADTLGSEIGQLYGRRTLLLTTFRPVPPGTEGAVSLEGTLAGIAGAAVLGAGGAAAGLFPWIGAGLVVVAAFVGTTLESLLGSTLERRGFLDNEAVNFLNTLVGAAVAGALSLVAL